MVAPRSTERPKLVLFVLIATAITLMTVQFRDFLPLREFQQGFRDVISPLRSTVDVLTDPVETIWDGIFNYEEVRKENELLENEVQRMRGEKLRNEADQELLERLLGEVDIKFSEREMLVARIIGVPSGNFNSHMLEIDKGSD